MADSKRPVVWIIQSQGDRCDYTQAENWGEVRPLFRSYVDLRAPELPSQIKQAVALVGRGDYLLLAGNKLLCGLVMHRVWERDGEAKLLNFNGPLGRYDAYTLADTFGLI